MKIWYAACDMFVHENQPHTMTFNLVFHIEHLTTPPS
jgi:hypothetical protein